MHNDSCFHATGPKLTFANGYYGTSGTPAYEAYCYIPDLETSEFEDYEDHMAEHDENGEHHD